MALPKLQIALDTLSIAEGIEILKKVKDHINIIEVGTILICSEGKMAIKTIKEHFPDKLIVADGKISDAAKIFGKMFFDSGADYTTAICAAEISTMKELVDLSNTYKNKKEIQVEMTSQFNWDQVEQWDAAGIRQVVWHRGRDAQAAGVKWKTKDIEAIAHLANMGFKVTVTGGIQVEDIKLFKDIPIYIFIAGRSIYEAKNPAAVAQDFQMEFKKYWS